MDTMRYDTVVLCLSHEIGTGERDTVWLAGTRQDDRFGREERTRAI